MRTIILYIDLFAWAVSVILGMGAMVAAWLKKDKEFFTDAGYYTVMMIVVGLVASIPMLFFLFGCAVMSRFDEPKDEQKNKKPDAST